MLSKSERFLTFLLDSHLCALKVSDVKEINHIVRAPSHEPNHLNIRDEAIPYFDLRTRLGFEHKALTQSSRTLILKTSAGIASTTVDAVHSVIDLYPDQWESLSSQEFPNFQNTTVIKGIATWRDQTVLLLDLSPITGELKAKSKAS